MKNMEDRTKDIAPPVHDRSRIFGAILVEQGRLSPQDVDKIQRYSRELGLRFGEAALRLNLLTQSDIDFALAEQYKYPILARGGEHGVSDHLVACYNPQSPLVEPLRELRSQLMLRWLNDTAPKVISICSPERGEGRSWLAANLAAVFAQIGIRTLLIDADLRQPSQHNLFNISNKVGLSALLTGRAGREIVRRINPQLRLFVLPSGVTPPNPQELLGRPVFDLVLNQFSEQYDVVVLDTPAITQAADAHILAALSGTAVMVARRNHTRHSQLTAAMHSLMNSGAKVVGSVINEY